MPTVRIGPIIGLIIQVGLLMAVDLIVGLGPLGWLIGLAYGVITCAALTGALNRRNLVQFGPADRVTLTRATLVGLVAALTAATFRRSEPVAVLVAIASVALVLDAVDGHVARRTGTASALGARFDMEIDAFLILVLSVYVARTVGAWVLAIGIMRYAYLAAGWVLPWLRGLLPPRFWGKVVAAVQGVVLVGAATGVLPTPVTVVVLVVSLGLLVESFGHSVGWLWRHRITSTVGG